MKAYKVAPEAIKKDTEFRVFGKPEAHKGRRMAVALASAANSKAAVRKALSLASNIKFTFK